MVTPRREDARGNMSKYVLHGNIIGVRKKGKPMKR